MKKIISLLAIALSLYTAVACKEDKARTGIENEKNVDPKSAKSDIFAVADKFHTAFRAKKAEDIKTLTTDTGFFAGTDPEEVFNQQTFIDYLRLKLTNPGIGTITYEIDRREIIFEDGGKGAILVDQFTPIVFTQNIPWRMTSHLVKKDGAWKFDFISFAMTPKNDVVPYINMAAHKEE
ncbi:nuclear transport factor 2 family protein [Flavobacterium hauense]